MNTTPLRRKRFDIANYLLSDEDVCAEVEVNPQQLLLDTIKADEIRLARLYKERAKYLKDVLLPKSKTEILSSQGNTVTVRSDSIFDSLEVQINKVTESIRKSVELLHKIGGITIETPEEFLEKVRQLTKSETLDISDDEINEKMSKYPKIL